ncbi:amino acid ABC transporter ATP-binding/permease protein [Macrococcus equi]|uniref:amino acid ABC transporter ATP-binding/permease protein n=1 Tax=Macrococcus equi TaxID=3395462 RepID=UPI0039BDED00
MRYLSRNTKKSLIIAIIIGTCGGLTAIGMFSLSGLMLSKSAYKVPLYSLMTLVATIKLFGVIRAICKYFERLISHEATFEMLKDVRVTTVRNLLENFISIQSRYHLSTLLNRTVNDIEKLQNLLLRVIYPPIIALSTAIIVILIYMQFSLYAVIVLFISMLILTLILPLIFSHLLERIVAQKIEATQAFERHFLDYQLSLEALRVFDKHDTYLAQLYTREAQMEDAIKKENKFIVIYDFLLNFISMIAIFMVILVMLYDPTHNTMMYLSIVMVAITLFEMSIPMVHFPYHRVETKQAVQHLDELNDKQHFSHINEGIFNITLKDVNVDTRLCDINLSIEKGQKIGIAGPSGAGKSTLINTILGLENITGDYYLNDKKINTPNHLLDMFCVMEQDNHFIGGTVADNMFTSIDKTKLNQLLRDFNLPFNSESEILSFGENLSGGEKKRLHLIRMILRDKPVWILDEPFNGVDIKNQKLMLDYLKQLTHHTIIIVSHDLTIFDMCDQLYLIDEGEIIEHGTPELLSRTDTKFHTLLQKQLLSI